MLDKTVNLGKSITGIILAGILSMIPVIIWGIVMAFLISYIGMALSMGIFIVLMLVPFFVIGFMVFKLIRKPFAAAFGSLDKGRILATGYDATATIQSISESSIGGAVTVNNQPYLNLKLMVDDGRNRPYPVSIDAIIPHSALPQLQPGAVISVKVDPSNPQKVTLDTSGQASVYSRSSAQSSRLVGNSDEWSTMDEVLLRQDGVDGMAKLLDIQDTGRSENFKPVVRMTYEVAIAGKESYVFSKDVDLPPDVIARLRNLIGKTYPCRVHPRDRKKIKVNVTF